MEKVDEECNGLLINSENFQALELLQEKYREAVKCVYIDPPLILSKMEILCTEQIIRTLRGLHC